MKFFPHIWRSNITILKRPLPDLFGQELAIGDVVMVWGDDGLKLAKVLTFIKPRKGTLRWIVSRNIDSSTEYYSLSRQVVWMDPKRITAHILSS